LFGAALLWAQPASADLVKTSSVAVSITGTSTTYTGISLGLNNNLTVGTPLTISDFIRITVNTVNSSGTNAGSISANFTFTDPTSATQSDSGTITGNFAGRNEKSIDIIWADPLTVTFTNGQSLIIDLADIHFDCSSPGCKANDFFTVAGTFTLTAAAVPGPIVGAGLPGLIAACGSLVAFARRRRRMAA
jgi:hypothetical protein